jgi:hypothetical protein
LRFRKVEFIQTITRLESYALTADAKKRTTQKESKMVNNSRQAQLGHFEMMNNFCILVLRTK